MAKIFGIRAWGNDHEGLRKMAPTHSIRERDRQGAGKERPVANWLQRRLEQKIVEIKNLNLLKNRNFDHQLFRLF